MIGITEGEIEVNDPRSMPNPAHTLPSCTASKNPSHNVSTLLHVDRQNTILPYQTMDANLVIHNTHSFGCGINIALDDTKPTRLIIVLMEILELLPSNIDCTIILHKHHHGDTILRESQHSIPYHSSLKDHQCYLFLSTRGSKQQLLVYRKRLERRLKLARYAYSHLGKTAFLILIRTWLAHPAYATQWPTLVDTTNRNFHTFLFPSHTTFTSNKTRLVINHQDAIQQHHQFQVVNCQLKSHDQQHLIHASATPLFQPQLLLPCPFWFSITLRKTPKKKVFTSFHNLALLTNLTQESKHLTQAAKYYAISGYQLTPSQHTQDLCFLAGFPFFITNHLYSALDQKTLMNQMMIQHLRSLLLIISAQVRCAFEKNF